MDFLEVLKTKVESLAYTPPIAMIGAYDTGNDSIALRPAPSSMGARYIDEGKVYPFSFQVLVHHKSSLSAYSMSQKLQTEFEKANTDFVSSSNGSFVLNKIEVTTTVNHVQKTDYGDLYTAIFLAELIIKGDGQ